MSNLTASCVAARHASGTFEPLHSAACAVVESAKKDPAGAARTLAAWNAAGLGAHLASEIAQHLSDQDVKTLARTPAGRDFLDTLEAGLASGGADAGRQAQIERIQSLRLASAANAQERTGELIRQAVSGSANVERLGRNLAAEVKVDINTGAALARMILANPAVDKRTRLANEIASNLNNQELLTLAKTPAGKLFLQQVRDTLKLPFNFLAPQAIRVAYALDTSNDSYAHHVAQVQADLYAKGLPTSARGVEVIAIEVANGGGHADAVRRMIDGENGLARDARVTMRSTQGHQAAYIQQEVTARRINTDTRTASIRDFASFGVAGLEGNLYAMREEIKSVRTATPADGKTRVLNISWGRDIAVVATELAGSVPRGSTSWDSAVESIVERTGRAPRNATEVRKELALQIATQMKTQMAQAANVTTLNKLRADLQDEVDKANAKGIVIFNAAGNDRQLAKDLGDESLATVMTDSIKGLITVGAAALGVTSTPRDDAMWQDSAPGADIAAPGAGVPVFRQNGVPANGSGSSFAAPYAASVAALMIAANPKITPKQIEQILTSPAVTRDLPGTTDGKGLIDPVKAVEEAKKLARR